MASIRVTTCCAIWIVFWRYWDASGNEIVTVNPASLRTSISPLIC